MPENIFVTNYQKGTYNESTGTGVEVYPKTHISQVVGLEETYAKKTDVGARTVLDGFDFSVAPTSLNGDYLVTNAVNSPFKANGMLTVTHSGSDTIEIWNDEETVAYRKASQINPLTSGINYLVVNGNVIDTTVLHDKDANGVRIVDMKTYGNTTVRTVLLAAGGTYIVSGALTNVRIAVGLSAKDEKDYNKLSKDEEHGLSKEQVQLAWLQTKGYALTFVRLNGLHIHFNAFVDTSDEDTALDNVNESEAMIYTSYPGEFIIELMDGSVNYLKRDLQTGMESVNAKAGVIYSEGADLSIIGNGSLGIYSMLGGHAIKSKKGLSIGRDNFSDTPRIAGHAYHDILHGNDHLYIYGGYFKDIYSNDFLGTDTSVGDQAVGKVRLYGGYFEMQDCGGTFLQADDAIVYPAVSIKYLNVGEGLWLQADEGLLLQCNAGGEVTGYTNVNYQAKTFVYRKYVTAYPFLTFDAAAATNTTTYPIDETKSVDQAFGRITVFVGVTVDNSNGAGTYKESIRNTCVIGSNVPAESSTNGEPFTANRVFASTPVPATWSGSEYASELEPTASQMNPANAGFDSITDTYSGTIFGGEWHVGVKESVFEQYKTDMEYIVSCISSMIVPPKSLAITSTDGVQKLQALPARTFKQNNKDGSFIENEISGFTNAEAYSYYAVTPKKTIKPDEYLYSTKTLLEPTFNLQVGDHITLKGVIDPENVTNNQIKWTLGESNDFRVIGRVKSEDTQTCEVIALQEGDEFMTVSVKALDKKYGIISMKVHFRVTAA